MSERKLTDQQELFCQEYLKDLNATAAAKRAKYSEKTAHSQGPRLLENVEVKARIQELMDKRAKRVEVKADDVLKELSLLGHSDIRELFKDDGCVKDPKDWPEHLARAVQSIETQETFEKDGNKLVWTGYTKKVKFWDKPKSLELLGKNQKLFTDRVEQTGTSTVITKYASMTDEEIEAKLKELLWNGEKK